MTKRGFTLIELSIVLVILGLIVGGIVGGRSLIHAAQIQSLVREYNGWMTAYNAFKLQYDAVPGDMRDGWDYFSGGVDTVCGNDNVSNNGCNGDGDGVMGTDASGSGSLAHAEHQRAWLHMEKAEIIIGKVTYGNTHLHRPISGYLPGSSTWWNSVPPAKGAGDGAMWAFFNPTCDSPSHSIGTYNPPVFFGRSGLWLSVSGPTTNNDPLYQIMTPKDAASIDKKLDDGIPTMGKVIANQGRTVTTQCESTNTVYSSMDTAAYANTDTYTLSNTDKSCHLLFYVGD